MQSINSTIKCENCVSKGSGIFCHLHDSELVELDRHKITNKFKKGQTLFVQGTPPFGIFCVSSGNVKVTQAGDDGKEAIVRIVKGGDVLGHRSLFTNEYYHATATALDDTQVCFIDKKYIVELIQQKPSVASNLLSKLGKSLGAAEAKVSSFSQKNVRERLAELLLLLKESHGEALDDTETFINIKLTREEMASMIGTASETLIRFMTELKQESLIRQDGKKIIITDEARLLEFAGISH